MGRKKKLKYEDCVDVIDNELRKRRHKWRLHALAWMDYDDVQQIIRAHIFKKWDQWDQKRSLAPWINKIISNQIKNIFRNYYTNFARPCLNCPFAQSSASEHEEGHTGLCGFTPSGVQCGECPLYSKWEKTKNSAHDIKMPLALEHHPQEVFNISEQLTDISEAERKLHKLMEMKLSEKHFCIYKMIYIDHLPEEDVAKKMGYKSNEKGRKAGYKQLKNLKKIFIERAKEIIDKRDIII